MTPAPTLATGSVPVTPRRFWPNDLSRFNLLLVIFASSEAALVVAVRQRPSLQLAIMASSLVSYHFLCHDGSVLLIPLAAALSSYSVREDAAAVSFPFAVVIPQYGF